MASSALLNRVSPGGLHAACYGLPGAAAAAPWAEAVAPPVALVPPRDTCMRTAPPTLPAAQLSPATAVEDSQVRGRGSTAGAGAPCGLPDSLPAHALPAHSAQQPPLPLVTLPGRLLVVGFGSIAAGCLPLILRHVRVERCKVTLLTAPDRGAEARAAAKQHGLNVVVCSLTPGNYREVVEPLLWPGDFLLNLSVDVSSCALIALCNRRRCLYLDTVVEPWAGAYTDAKLSLESRSNYALREEALTLKRAFNQAAGAAPSTALITHGANPGLVSHLVKRALLDVAKASGVVLPEPTTQQAWAALACHLGVRCIHVAERDSQASGTPKRPGEFVNTWSVDGFIAEGCQPAELGWGTHEASLPRDGKTHHTGSGAAIYLTRPGCATRVRSWCPGEGAFHGFLVTHNEAISVADWLTLREGVGGAVSYRPTVHYAYHPCDAALASLHELAGKGYVPQSRKRILDASEVLSGCDELGVLLCGMPSPAPHAAYWLGSTLSCAAAREMVPHNSATTLQVTATILGGMVWVVEHPHEGVLEPEEMRDWRRVLDVAEPYIAPLVGAWSDWTPLQGRTGAAALFPEQLDELDPWQFSNVRVD